MSQQAAASRVKQVIKMEPPKDWLKMIENIRQVRAMYPAPVDFMGCDQSHYQTSRPVEQRFLVLVSLILSSQTKDPITWAAVQKLRAGNLGSPQAMVDARAKDIEDLIHPVGFYRRKAVYLKRVCEILLEKHDGDIPNSIEQLCELPGVGPKMAHLCMQEAWNVVTGIGVDTHVHRIAGRLGWVPEEGIKKPEDTRKALEQWLPREYWREINHMLVGFGQTICTPLHPKCSKCFNSNLCPSSSVNAPSCNIASAAKKQKQKTTTMTKQKKEKKKETTIKIELETKKETEQRKSGIEMKRQVGGGGTTSSGALESKTEIASSSGRAGPASEKVAGAGSLAGAQKIASGAEPQIGAVGPATVSVRATTKRLASAPAAETVIATSRDGGAKKRRTATTATKTETKAEAATTTTDGVKRRPPSGGRALRSASRATGALVVP